LQFLYVWVLKRRDMKEDLPYPKRPKRLPVVLSREEVGRLIISAKNPCYNNSEGLAGSRQTTPLQQALSTIRINVC
jgi:site-specific recombinase XerD